MKQLYLLVICCAILFCQAFAQKDSSSRKLSKEESKELLEQLNLDSSVFLRNASLEACDCIDSVNKIIDDKNKKIEAFADCIDQQVNGYQLALQLLKSLKGEQKDNTISISTNKESTKYRRYYFEIERWLKDSCQVLNNAISTNDEEGKHSFSDNQDALDAYYKGVDFLKQENYAEGIVWFEKAVTIDFNFAFAWDNLGICYRRTNKLDKAESAYKSSLKIDPKGKTALQNLPVVYLLQKKDDEAITAYNSILEYYPNDPEVYYGIALVYYQNKKDMEKALDNMCNAYNIYIEMKSPFRSDAEKVINMIYTQMKKDKKENAFYKILKEHNIKTN